MPKWSRDRQGIRKREAPNAQPKTTAAPPSLAQTVEHVAGIIGNLVTTRPHPARAAMAPSPRTYQCCELARAREGEREGSGIIHPISPPPRFLARERRRGRRRAGTRGALDWRRAEAANQRRTGRETEKETWWAKPRTKRLDGLEMREVLGSERQFMGLFGTPYTRPDSES